MFVWISFVAFRSVCLRLKLNCIRLTRGTGPRAAAAPAGVGGAQRGGDPPSSFAYIINMLRKQPTHFRHVCFTINNPTPEDLELLHKMSTTYLVYGREKGENETPHLQGYLELPKQMRFKRVKASLPRAHLEPRYGSAKSASDYCKKGEQTKDEWEKDGIKGIHYGKNADVFEEGEISQQGKRTDIARFVDSIKQGLSTIDVIERHPVEFVKYTKAYDRIRMEYAREDREFEKPTVIVHYGKAGTGKTRTAYEEPDLYLVPQNNSQWFDGYHGQEAIMYDDYSGQTDVEYFLKLIDGYKFALPIKGGFTWKQWTTVYITSNFHPETWYPEGLSERLKRRITEIKNFE